MALTFLWRGGWGHCCCVDENDYELGQFMPLYYFVSLFSGMRKFLPRVLSLVCLPE